MNWMQLWKYYVHMEFTSTTSNQYKLFNGLQLYVWSILCAYMLDCAALIMILTCYLLFNIKLETIKIEKRAIYDDDWDLKWW